MSEWTIYYNPKCGTCRKTREILKQKKISPRIVEYLKTPPNLKDLESIWKKLGAKAREIIRTKEPLFDDLRLAGAEPAVLLKAIEKHPVLLQRPVVVRDDRAVVARPPEKVEDLF